jgi:Flp pilus assembly protein TadG
MVELAVVLPVLILIAIGVMDYGRVYFTSIAVANAARAGAEFGTSAQGNTTNQTSIRNFAMLDGAEVSPITVNSRTIFKCGDTDVTNTSTCGSYGVPRVYVEVTASKTVSLILRYPGLPSTVLISRTATFRYQ